MSDNEVSGIVDQINENTQKIKDLKEALEMSEARRETAERLVTEIKSTANDEIKKAYESGYNAALTSTNPTGGTTISNQENKTLVLSNQN